MSQPAGAAGARVSVLAPAKINLCLHVTGRRPDGYHTLDSLMAFVGLADTLAAEPAPAGHFSLSVDGPFADRLPPATDDNLVLRAGRALAAAAGVRAGAAFALTKRIPVAAGLGGGSADAAAALRALAALWRLPADLPLAGIALSLGADVPVCHAGRAARVTGIGEGLDVVAPLPDAGVVLVNPGVALDTGAVFAAFDRAAVISQADRAAVISNTDRGAEPAISGAAPGPAGTAVPTGPFADAAALARALRPCRNDLAAAALALAPAIGDVLAALGGAPGCRLARMSGSGATCFALFDDRAAAEAARTDLAARHPGWWSWAGGFAA